ncbi:hypothetical protein FKP32DRAFT_523888 [Trametes sanguinea]|nr:hypothetical protein FKP32DRAFT_523888 [Trametes sanguinea]
MLICFETRRSCKWLRARRLTPSCLAVQVPLLGSIRGWRVSRIDDARGHCPALCQLSHCHDVASGLFKVHGDLLILAIQGLYVLASYLVQHLLRLTVEPYTNC